MATKIDISSELSVIAIEPYGDAVKTAVHDAIQKVNSGGASKNDRPSEVTILANAIQAACAPGIADKEENTNG